MNSKPTSKKTVSDSLVNAATILASTALKVVERHQTEFSSAMEECCLSSLSGSAMSQPNSNGKRLRIYLKLELT